MIDAAIVLRILRSYAVTKLRHRIRTVWRHINDKSNWRRIVYGRKWESDRDSSQPPPCARFLEGVKAFLAGRFASNPIKTLSGHLDRVQLWVRTQIRAPQGTNMQILKVCADRKPVSWPKVITNRQLGQRLLFTVTIFLENFLTFLPHKFRYDCTANFHFSSVPFVIKYC